MKTYRSPLLLLAIVAGGVARSDESAPAARSMTLRDALAYAEAHAPDLLAARARVDAVRTQREVSQARWYPTITGVAELFAGSANNSTGSYVGVSGFDNPRVSATAARNAVDNSWSPNATSLLGLGVRQQVYDFGRISAESAAETLRGDAERLSAAGVKLVVDEAVEEAYFAVYAAKAVVQAAESARLRAQVHRDQAKASVDVGMRRPIDLTRAQAVLERYELAGIRARGSVTIAEAVLAAAVGVPEQLVDIATTPPTPAELPSLQAALDASDRNPELRSVLTLMRAQEKQTQAIRAELRPNLLASGAISGNAGGATPTSGQRAEYDGFLPIVPNWDVGLVLSWPLFDQTVRARTNQSRATEQLYRQQAAAVQRRLAGNIEVAYIDVAVAREALPVLQRTLQAAVANYDQANARFNAGMGDAVEMADAEELRTTAEIDLARGQFEVARTRAVLGRFLAEGL